MIHFVFLKKNLIRIELDMVGFVVADQQRAVVVPVGNESVRLGVDPAKDRSFKESIRLGNPFDEPVNNSYGSTGRNRSRPDLERVDLVRCGVSDRETVKSDCCCKLYIFSGG